jgi:cobalt-zinc-cadmium efflux system membrane fusion protein
MKLSITLALLLCALPAFAEEEESKPNRAESTIILDAAAIRHIGLETAEAEEQDFEETVLALGSIEVLPANRAVVSTRIPGRATTVIGKADMQCEAGDELLWVESRQPGDPPPVIRVDAPIGGFIAKVNVARGQPVEPGMSLMEIYDLSVVEAHAAVPQHLAGRIGKGMEAHIRVPGFEDTWTVELAHIGADADAESGTVEAAFHIPNDDGRLRPGMRAEFSLVLTKTPGVQAVPRAAVMGDAAGRYVFIRDYELERAFVKTPVVTGMENDRFIEITEGLLPGDEVVIKGAYALSFAGKGSVSLKEALDAAHGHPHNEDGTEMTKEQQAAHAAAHGGEDHDHGHGGALLWQIISGVLALVVGVMSFYRRGAESAEEKQSNKYSI